MTAAATDRILFEDGVFRLSATRLEQEGLVAELVSSGHLVITRCGVSREVPIPSEVPEGCASYRSDIPVLVAMYRLALHELQRDVSEQGLMLAGANWPTAWTRDVAYAVALGAGLAMPAPSRASLVSRVREGIILQDTGTGGGWPVSTDRVVWALGAWVIYLTGGDKAWLTWCVEVLEKTLEQDARTLSLSSGLYPGETSFIDWREQSYPDAMGMAEIGASYALSTNVLHYMARHILAQMLGELGRGAEAEPYAEEATRLGRTIEEKFHLPGTGLYGMYRTASGYLDDRTDSLAHALAVLSGLAGEKAPQMMRRLPSSAYGYPVFSPYKSSVPGAYHNRAVWPFVQGFVLLAQAEVQNMALVERSMACMLRSALAFGTNKENLNAETGNAEDTLLNSDRQLWSVAGMLGVFYYALFGIQFDHQNLVFSPCVPKGFAGSHWLTGLRLRGMTLDVHLNGYGNEICSFRVNGRMTCPIIPLDTVGRLQIEMELLPGEDEAALADVPPAAGEDLPEPEWNHPLPDLLRWNPVPGASSYCVYADGTALATTAACRYQLPPPGELVHTYHIQAWSADSFSCLSAPYDAVSPEFRHVLQPLRVGEEAEYEVEHGQAWLDTRPCTRQLDYEAVTLPAGTYRLRVLYSNATASRRDGDTCALRQLFINGVPGPVLPLPHHTEQGRWQDFAYTAPVSVSLEERRTRFSLRYTDRCVNMNGHINQCMVRSIELLRLS